MILGSKLWERIQGLLSPIIFTSLLTPLHVLYAIALFPLGSSVLPFSTLPFPLLALY